MRIQSAVTSVSWIPSAAITGLTRIPFERGVAHYDDPPPDRWTDLGSVLGLAAGHRREDGRRSGEDRGAA